MEEMSAFQQNLTLFIFLEYFGAEAHNIGDERIVVLAAHAIDGLECPDDYLEVLQFRFRFGDVRFVQ